MDEAPRKVTSSTFDQCVENASRILQFAEMEADLVKMERLESLADSWTSLAHVVLRALTGDD